jgi:hypothetical protein
MVDTFRPLRLTKQAAKLDNPDYAMSWTVEHERHAEITTG